MYVESPDEIEEIIQDDPKELLDMAFELAKLGRYEDSMSAIDRYLNLDLEDKIKQQVLAGLNYAKCGNLMVSLSEIREAPEDPELLEACDDFAEKCFRKSIELGWTFSDAYRNTYMMKRLVERDGFLEAVGVELTKTLPENRTEWRTVDDSMVISKRKNFLKQPNGDWLETGVDTNGKPFENRLRLHLETPNYVELQKYGTNVRVRLWEDKSFWGSVSSRTDSVSSWRFLQTGKWISPEK